MYFLNLEDIMSEKKDILEKVLAKRGYLLTYHKMIGEWDPKLLDAYDNFYENLTLNDRTLSKKNRELVWAALQVAADEEHGHIHMKRAKKIGLSEKILTNAIALAGAAESHRALWFGFTHWSEWIPNEFSKTCYLNICESARGEIEPKIAEIILIVCHAARRSYGPMRLHLGRAFKLGTNQAELAEALSYMLLPCGGPTLIDAVKIWEEEGFKNNCPSPY
tara:strand:+ start:147 stop:806 length:660 start_codon:yes stop_codon:yes gene_type:complete